MPMVTDERLVPPSTMRQMIEDEFMTTEEAFRERQVAVRRVLGTLLHPMKMLCIPDREKAYQDAVKYKMTAVDLLNAARNIERSQFTIEG